MRPDSHPALLLLAAALLPLPAAAAEPTFSGATGLLTVPTAQVQAQGTATFAASHFNPDPDRFEDVGNYTLLVGFLPGLELGGRVVDATGVGGASGIRDLSLNPKLRLWGADSEPSLAIGAQDLGGAAQHFRSTYAVATLPWRSVNLSLGYGWGPDVLQGVLGGIEWRPWSFLGLVGEYDTEHFNGGLRLESPTLPGGLRLGASAAYRAAVDEVEYGAHVTFAFGGGASSPPELLSSPRKRGSSAEPDSAATPPALVSALTDLGFESVRVGVRDPGVQVVTLENRRYNHSSADGISVALGAIAARVGPDIQQIELTTKTYGVAQVTVEVPAALVRQYVQDPGAVGPALAQALRARPGAGVDESSVRWQSPPAPPLGPWELVLEPVLRTFVATEYGVLDYGLGVRGRITAPVGPGLIGSVALQVPVVESDDFHDGRNFAPVAPRFGMDQMVLQYLHKPAPQWTTLWSAGRLSVYQSDLVMAALDQAWVSESGAHRWRARLMTLHAGSEAHDIALGGYTWFDASRDYSVALTGGRFYAGDSGFRLDVNRYFGDTIVGVFFKAASLDDQAGGIAVSLPLTPRRDAYPSGLQVKGPRRWGHSLSSTLNGAGGRNTLRPLLLYEPPLDLDLQRDLLDSGRLGESWLREQFRRGQTPGSDPFSAGR